MRNHSNKETAISNSKTEIRTSTISGKGTFAKKKIAAGEYILTLEGEPLVAVDKNIIKDQQDPLQIDDDTFLILNLASKLINHSCNPNAGIRNKSDLYAIKDINVNDEITYDYSTTSGIDDVFDMKCNCKSVNCRHQIGTVLTIPPDTLANYIQLNALPDFIRLQLKKIGKLDLPK